MERAATLEDVRAEVLTPDRLNAMVFGGFALVALTIAVVGVAGVLANFRIEACCCILRHDATPETNGQTATRFVVPPLGGCS